jgi:ABC-type uncharacterized transport system involved in gliding motility auxiliary subunit
VPEDATAVIIPGPVYPFDPAEVTMLSEYLSSGGALILMQDSPLFTEVGDQEDYLGEYLLDSWGVQLGDDLIIDQTSILGAMNPVGVADGTHPILENLQGITTGFPSARSVRAVEPTGGEVSREIITTVNEGSWAETDLETIMDGGEVSYNEGVDLLGPVPLVVVAENATNSSRVVVFGDVDFAMNSNFTFLGNGDLFIGAVDWVVGQEELITLTPKTPTQRIMLPPQPYLMNLILLLVVIVMPGAVLVAGIIVWLRKRQRG